MRKQSSKTSNRQLERKKEGYTHQYGRWKINPALSEHLLDRHFQGGKHPTCPRAEALGYSVYPFCGKWPLADTDYRFALDASRDLNLKPKT